MDITNLFCVQKRVADIAVKAIRESGQGVHYGEPGPSSEVICKLETTNIDYRSYCMDYRILVYELQILVYELQILVYEQQTQIYVLQILVNRLQILGYGSRS